MKTTYPVNAHRKHSEHLNNSFQTTVLFLLTLGITAFALAGCDGTARATQKSTETANISKMQLTTGNRTVGPVVSNSN
jgi:hypothetical protein